MKFRKILSAVTALAMSASAVAGLAVTANAAATTDNVSVTATYINAGSTDINYSSAGVLYANYCKISGGALSDQLSAYGGADATLLLVDLSDYKEGEATVTDVILNLTSTCTSSGNKSTLQLATTTNTDWDYESITWSSHATDLGTITYNSDIGEASSSGASFNHDIKTIYNADSDGILSLVIYTATGRQQELSDISVDITTTTDTLYSYTVNAYADGTKIAKLASDDDVADSTITITGLPEVVSDGNTYYQLDSSVSNRTISFDLTADGYEAKVEYNADDTIAFFIEGENLTPSRAADASSTSGDTYSGGVAYTINGNRNLYTSVTLGDGVYSFTVAEVARVSSKGAAYTGTVTIGDITVGSLTGATSGTIEESFSDITISGGTYTLMVANGSDAIPYIDYIIIYKTGDIPATMTVATSDSAISLTTTDSTEMTDADDNVTIATYGDVVNEGTVTTLYIKMTNATEEPENPTVTLNDGTTTAKASQDSWYYSPSSGTYYFIYQFVDLDSSLNGATVACDGYDDASVSLD